MGVGQNLEKYPVPEMYDGYMKDIRRITTNFKMGEPNKRYSN